MSCPRPHRCFLFWDKTVRYISSKSFQSVWTHRVCVSEQTSHPSSVFTPADTHWISSVLVHDHTWVSQEVFRFISTLEIKTWEKLKALCFFSEWKDFPSWGTSLKTSGVVLHVKPHRQMFLFSNSYFILSKANCSCDVTFWLNCSVGRFLSLSEFILFGDVF